MKARFIGHDGSMGLRHGKMYDIQICCGKNFHAVLWKKGFLTTCIGRCLYSSAEGVFDNWELRDVFVTHEVM